MAKILVVEDEPNIRELLTMVLAMDGHEIEAAADGEAGLTQALANPPDLAILDVLMPKLDGLHLAAMLRKDPRTARQPILILSACDGIRDQALAIGVNDVVQKPVRTAVLRQRVAALLAAGPQMESDPVLRSPASLEGLAFPGGGEEA